MVKEFKAWKITWHKNDDEQGGSQDASIKKCKEDEIVVKSQTVKNGSLWASISPSQFLELIQTNKGLYEVITKFPHKVYFDIDKKGEYNDEEFQNYKESVKEIILRYFPNANFAISGSNDNKASLHIILNNYVIQNEEDRLLVKSVAKYINENIDNAFDWKVYTKNRNMKIINQSKPDGRVQEILENNNEEAHFITCFIDKDNLLPLNITFTKEEISDEVQITKSNTTFDLGKLPKMQLKTTFNGNVNNLTPLEILQLLPINASFDHQYTHLVARFCYFNGITFEQFFAWIKNKHIEKIELRSVRDKIKINIEEALKFECKRWKDYNWSKLDRFQPVSCERMHTILFKYYPHIKKDYFFRRFADSFVLPEDKIKIIDRIEPEHFLTDEKYVVFNAGMGQGKTAQTIDYLFEQQGHSFCWLAVNKALAHNTLKRLKDANIECFDYLKMKTKDKKDGLLDEQHRLMIVLNSIHYVKRKNYNIVVIDEVETIINNFYGDFLDGKENLKKDIWMTFKRIVQQADKVILLDAFITNKTIDLFKKSIEREPSMIIYKTITNKKLRTIEYVKNYETALDLITRKLNMGLKLFIFYPFKRQMEEVNSLIKEKTNKKGKCYNADTDDSIKKGLNDVNKAWENLDYIITNNVITCGVNYENMDFDEKFLFVASHNSPRDIIQVSFRARYLKNNLIHVCYIDSSQNKTTFLNDKTKINDKAYSDMYDNIMIEKMAPLKPTFQFFCTQASYHQRTNNKVIDDAIKKEIKDLLEKHSFGYKFDSIETIDDGYAEHIQGKCFEQEATMYEKQMLHKYYFLKNFTEVGQNHDYVEEIWNQKLNFFLNQIKFIFLDTNCLFNKIAKYNNQELLIPVNVKKTKLNSDIIDDIFNHFTFKKIKKESCSWLILKENLQCLF